MEWLRREVSTQEGAAVKWQQIVAGINAPDLRRVRRAASTAELEAAKVAPGAFDQLAAMQQGGGR